MDYAVEYFNDFKKQREDTSSNIFPSIAQLLGQEAGLVVDAQGSVAAMDKNSAVGMVLSGVLSLVVSLGKMLLTGAAFLGRMILTNPYCLAALGITAAGVGAYKLLTGRKEDGDVEAQKEASNWSPFSWVDRPRQPTPSYPKDMTKSRQPTPSYPKDMTKSIHKKASVIRSVVEGAKVVGVDPNLMLGIVKAESSFGQLTRNKASSAQGIFQILPSTWRQYYPRFARKYGIPKNDPNDPESAAIFSAAYVKEVLNPIVRKAKGDDATAADLYMLYVFGPAGGAALIKEYAKNPNAYSAAVHSKRSYGQDQINKNPTFFYHKDGTPKTLAETFGLAKSKVAFTNSEKVALQSFSVKPANSVQPHGETAVPPTYALGQDIEDDYELVRNKEGRLVKVKKV